MRPLRRIDSALRQGMWRVGQRLVQAYQWLQARTATWLWLLWGLSLVGAGVVSAWWVFRRQIGTLLDPETLDFLQLAANVAAGKGLSTFVLRPLGLSPDFTPTAQPDLYHPPLPAIVWGAVFAVLGRSDERLLVLLTGAFVGFTAALLFFLTARLVHRWAALVAAGLFFAAPATLAVGGSGQIVALSAALFSLWLVLLTRKAVWDRRFALGTGALLGLTGLANGLTLLATPFALLSRRWLSWRERGWFLLALLLVLLPYAGRNVRLTGIPLTPWKAYAFLWDTRAFPSDSIYRHAFAERPSPLALTVQHAGVIVRKGLENARRSNRLGSAFGWFVLLGVLTAPVWWKRWRGTFLRLTTAMTLGTSISALILLLLTRPSADALFFLLAPACLLTAANMAALAEWLLTTRGWQWLTRPLVRAPYLAWAMGRLLPAASLGILLLLAQGFVGRLFLKRLVPIRWDPVAQAIPLAEGFAAAYKGNDLFASDEPRLLAVRWRRPVVWLPCHREDWERLKLWKKVTHIWLSPNALLQPGGNADTELRRTLLTGLPFLDRYYPTVVRGPRFLLPTSFLIRGEPRNNRPLLDKTLETMPIEQLIERAEKHQRNKEYVQAERMLWVALYRQPSTEVAVRVFFNLGAIWLEQKRFYQAIQAFQAMLGEAPGNYAGANNLAWTYLQLYGQLAQLPEPPPFLDTLLAAAERWAEQALATCPPDPRTRAHILDTAGWVDFLQGRTKARRGQDRWRLARARSRLEEAYRLMPDHPTIRQGLAAVYTELGMAEKAERLLNETVGTPSAAK